MGDEQVMSVRHIFKKGYIFWDKTSCSSFRVNLCFGETFRSACYLFHGGFFLG
jgi:hypothetical protein